MKKRLDAALDEQVEQQDLFKVLSSSIDKKLIEKWTNEIKAWEKDHSLEDPYQVVGSGASILMCILYTLLTTCAARPHAGPNTTRYFYGRNYSKRERSIRGSA